MFNTKVNRYCASLPSEIQAKVEHLRHLLLNTAPHCEETFKYAVPFYSCFGAFAYINYSKSKLLVGFVEGINLPDINNRLSAQHNKKIRHFVFENFDKNELDEFKCFIFLAAEFNMKKKLVAF